MRIFLFTLMLLSAQCFAADYQYLMTHPQALTAAENDCQQQSSNECKIVQQAADDFQGLVNNRSMNPEAFGQKILDLQMDQAKLAKQGMVDAKETLWDKSKLSVYLAVVAATSPE